MGGLFHGLASGLVVHVHAEAATRGVPPNQLLDSALVDRLAGGVFTGSVAEPASQSSTACSSLPRAQHGDAVQLEVREDPLLRCGQQRIPRGRVHGQGDRVHVRRGHRSYRA